MRIFVTAFLTLPTARSVNRDFTSRIQPLDA